jgi:spore maturation protein CgeB
VLIPPRDAGVMAAAITRLVNYPDAARTIADRARETVLFRHTPEARVQRLCNIYGSVLRNGPLMAAGAPVDGNFNG